MELQEVRTLLVSMLSKMGVVAERVDVLEDRAHPVLHIQTSDSAKLIGAHGETLRAFNHVFKKIVEAKAPDAPPLFLIDVNSYYSRRLREIKQQAHLLAERARTFKAEVAMPPANSYERMIIHATYANDPEVYTESAGVGRERHIVFKYKAAKREAAASRDAELFAG